MINIQKGINPPAPLNFNADCTLPISIEAAAIAIKDSAICRWGNQFARPFDDLQGRWLGGHCSPETRVQTLATLLDFGVENLHPGLQVRLDACNDGYPTAFMVANPRTVFEIPVRLSPYAFRIAGAVVPLDLKDSGRRILEVAAREVAKVIASPDGTCERRRGRRHD